MHAREWVPPDALVYLAADLLEAHAQGTGLRYGGQSFSAEQIRDLVEGLSLVLFPCVNPDGRHYSQTVEPLWRKNRRTVQPGLPPPASASTSTATSTRYGTSSAISRRTRALARRPTPAIRRSMSARAAASEPETQNVVWLIDQHPAHPLVRRRAQLRAGDLSHLGLRREPDLRPRA